MDYGPKGRDWRAYSSPDLSLLSFPITPPGWVDDASGRITVHIGSDVRGLVSGGAGITLLDCNGGDGLSARALRRGVLPANFIVKPRPLVGVCRHPSASFVIVPSLDYPAAGRAGRLLVTVLQCCRIFRREEDAVAGSLGVIMVGAETSRRPFSGRARWRDNVVPDVMMSRRGCNDPVGRSAVRCAFGSQTCSPAPIFTTTHPSSPEPMKGINAHPLLTRPRSFPGPLEAHTQT